MSNCSAFLFSGCPGKPTCERTCVPVITLPSPPEPRLTGRKRTMLAYAVVFITVSLVTFTGLSIAEWEYQQTIQERV